jgi:hypothetical protein
MASRSWSASLGAPRACCPRCRVCGYCFLSSTEALLLAPGGVALNVYVTGSDVGAVVPAMDFVEYLMLMMYVPAVAIV